MKIKNITDEVIMFDNGKMITYDHEHMISWRDKEPTQKQLDLIEEMEEFSDFPLPAFKGATRGEAHYWIQQNWKAAHESSWAIEHGYE